MLFPVAQSSLELSYLFTTTSKLPKTNLTS